MKKLSLLLLFSIFTLTLSAQDYTIIQVNGTIKVKRTNAVLKRGDKIKADDQLIFQTKDAVAAAFSSGKGRITLRLDPQTPKTGDEFLAYVKSSVVPAKGALMTRAGGAIKNRIEWDNYFAKGPYLVLPNTKVNISEKAWPMNDSTFFFLRYEYEGEQINKKLPTANGKLVLSGDHILLVDDEPVDAESISGHTIYHYHAGTQESVKMSEFEPVFADEKELVEEVKSLVELLRGYNVEEDKLRGEVEAFLVEYYGKPDPETLTEWLATHIGLE